MTNIFRTISKIIKKIVSLFSRGEQNTPEPAPCMKCKDPIDSNSKYLNFCQSCGDDTSETLDLVDTEITDEDLDFENLHRWGW